MHISLYMSYWVGMDASLCGVHSRNLTVTADLTNQTIRSMVLALRAPIDTYVESCYYLL